MIFLIMLDAIRRFNDTQFDEEKEAGHTQVTKSVIEKMQAFECRDLEIFRNLQRNDSKEMKALAATQRRTLFTDLSEFLAAKQSVFPALIDHLIQVKDENENFYYSGCMTKKEIKKYFVPPVMPSLLSSMCSSFFGRREIPTFAKSSSITYARPTVEEAKKLGEYYAKLKANKDPIDLGMAEIERMVADSQPSEKPPSAEVASLMEEFEADDDFKRPGVKAP